MHDLYQWCRHCNVYNYIVFTMCTCTFLLIYIVGIALLIDIESTSCLHRLNRRYRNVDQHRVDIAFTSCTFFLVYIVRNAMFIDIESTPCLYIPLLSCIDRNCVYMYIVRLLYCITSSTLQC